MTFQPVIKWSGSKRSQADRILEFFPRKIKTYYEPFVGGGSVMKKLLSSDIEVESYVCSDLNSDLIDLWNLIKENPVAIADSYEKMWNELNVDEDMNRKKEYYYKVRKRFNEDKDPIDFMFIMRTAVNGMPRYNLKGEFNTSFHVTRDGINPKTLRGILLKWSKELNDKNVEFICQDYRNVKPTKGDFIYLDPPYVNTKGMYYGGLNCEDLWEWLRFVGGDYALSFNGVSGDVDNTYEVPKDIYDRHEYLLSGNSSFKRTVGISSDSVVYESLYLKG